MPDILIALFGNAAYEFIKKLTRDSFGGDTSELELRVQRAIEKAAECFFNEYGSEFGKESDSFLARKENWIRITEKIKSSNPQLSKDDINPEGFKDDCVADSEAIEYFIDCLKEAYQNDFFLNLLIETKEIKKTTKETERKLIEALQKFDKKISREEINDLKVEVSGGDLPSQSKLVDGKLYYRNITSSLKLSYMKRGNKIYSEVYLGNGAVMYYEIDENAHISIKEPPYPVKLFIDPKYVIDQKVVVDSEGKKKIIIYGKWGLRIECEEKFENNYENTKFYNASVSINSKDKLMVIKPRGIFN